MVKLRSIPPRTYLSLMREGKLKSVARNWNRSGADQMAINQAWRGRRGKMRPQISRKLFEDKLSYLQKELEELSQFTADGFDISKLKLELENQIARFLQFLN